MDDSSRVVATGHTGAVSVDWVEALRMLGTLNAQTAICHESDSESSGTGGIHTVEPLMRMITMMMIIMMRRRRIRMIVMVMKIVSVHMMMMMMMMKVTMILLMIKIIIVILMTRL